MNKQEIKDSWGTVIIDIDEPYTLEDNLNLKDSCIYRSKPVDTGFFAKKEDIYNQIESLKFNTNFEDLLND